MCGLFATGGGLNGASFEELEESVLPENGDGLVVDNFAANEELSDSEDVDADDAESVFLGSLGTGGGLHCTWADVESVVGIFVGDTEAFSEASSVLELELVLAKASLT